MPNLAVLGYDSNLGNCLPFLWGQVTCNSAQHLVSNFTDPRNNDLDLASWKRYQSIIRDGP